MLLLTLQLHCVLYSEVRWSNVEGQFNGETLGEGIITENGFKIYAGDGETFFNVWKSSEEIMKNSKFEDKRFYKQTDWVLSILQSQDLVLRKYTLFNEIDYSRIHKDIFFTEHTKFIFTIYYSIQSIHFEILQVLNKDLCSHPTKNIFVKVFN